MKKENLTLEGLNQRFDELMAFLVENVATKNDLLSLEDRMEKRFDGKLESMEGRFDNKLDLLRNDLIQEIRSVRQEVELLRRDVERLEKRITEDSDVFAADIIQLKDRVVWLEKQVKQLKLA